MKPLLIICIAALVGSTAFAGDLRVWNLKNGETVEAEFVTVIGGKVTFKQESGKLIKFPLSSISRKDRIHIELSQPPTLDFNFSKSSTSFYYPPLTPWFESNIVPPRSILYSFSAEIKQASVNPYNHDLTAEVFVMAVEADGGKNILIDYREKTVRLSAENGRSAEIPCVEELMLTTYLAPRGIWRGEKYAGYMIVVTDARGEIVGHKATSEWWFEKLDNLRKVPVGKTFDKEGNRTWPTRPNEISFK